MNKMDEKNENLTSDDVSRLIMAALKPYDEKISLLDSYLNTIETRVADQHTQVFTKEGLSRIAALESHTHPCIRLNEGQRTDPPFKKDTPPEDNRWYTPGPSTLSGDIIKSYKTKVKRLEEQLAALQAGKDETDDYLTRLIPKADERDDLYIDNKKLKEQLGKYRIGNRELNKQLAAVTKKLDSYHPTFADMKERTEKFAEYKEAIDAIITKYNTRGVDFGLATLWLGSLLKPFLGGNDHDT